MEHRQMMAVLIGVVVLSMIGMFVLPSEPAHNRQVSSIFQDSGVTGDQLSRFETLQTRTSMIANIPVKTVTARLNDTRMKVRFLSDAGPAIASQYTKDSIQQTLGMFTQQEAPYAAVPVPQVDCTDGFKPNITRYDGSTSQNKTVIRLFADKNRAFTCKQGEAVYRAAVVLLYCPRAKTMMELKIFAPEQQRERLSRLVSSIRCRA